MPGGDDSMSKVKAFHNFMANDEQLLICTHANLRLASEELEENVFGNCLLAIDTSGILARMRHHWYVVIFMNSLNI